MDVAPNGERNIFCPADLQSLVGGLAWKEEEMNDYQKALDQLDREYPDSEELLKYKKRKKERALQRKKTRFLKKERFIRLGIVFTRIGTVIGAVGLWGFLTWYPARLMERADWFEPYMNCGWLWIASPLAHFVAVFLVWQLVELTHWIWTGDILYDWR